MSSIFVALIGVAVLQQPGWSLLTGAPSLIPTCYDSNRGRLVQFTFGQTDRRTQVWERAEAWHLLGPTFPAPPARGQAAAEYHPGRRLTVLFGGVDPQGSVMGDFWGWDGTNWLALGSGPSARAGHRMVYNPLTNSILLYGGLDASGRPLDDTWEWDGQSWRYLAQGPGPASSVSLAYDPVLRGVLMFGGSGSSVASGTWLWNGASWRQVAASGPEPRAGAACSVEWSQARILLHGGFGTAPQRGYADTWAWDGSAWNRLDAGISMQPRLDASMVYDFRMGSVVMGSGFDLSRGSILNDLWVWGATGWQALEEVPPRRNLTAIVCDETDGSMVLFGGTGTGASPVFSDTWTLRGAQWRHRHPLASPPSRAAHAMAYDAARREVVLFGGMHSPVGQLIDLDDTWIWRQGQWRLAQPVHRPGARRYGSMAFDRGRQQMVLYGGGVWPNLSSDTWLWDGSDWVLASTAGSGLIQPSTAYDERRQCVVAYGRTFPDGITVTREWTGTAWQFRAFAPDVDGSLVYDEQVGACLLVGQNHRTGVGELWRWDGATWSLLQNHDLRFTRLAAAYDWNYQRTVVFGGLFSQTSGLTLLGETWLYQPHTLSARSREPLLGSTAAWDLALPFSSGGLPFVLGLSGGADGIPVRLHHVGMPILWPLSPDRLFRLTLGLPSLVGVLDGTGHGTASLRLPNDPSLDGLRLFASGLTLGASLQPVDVTPSVSIVLAR